MKPFPGDPAWLDRPVADLLKQWPGAVRAFLDHRMACPGCPFSVFDTLAEALAIHHVPIDAFTTDVERAIGRAVGSPSGKPSPQGEKL
jgi:hybrid cluster-associated redox disulfide protein